MSIRERRQKKGELAIWRGLIETIIGNVELGYAEAARAAVEKIPGHASINHEVVICSHGCGSGERVFLGKIDHRIDLHAD